MESTASKRGWSPERGLPSCDLLSLEQVCAELRGLIKFVTDDGSGHRIWIDKNDPTMEKLVSKAIYTAVNFMIIYKFWHKINKGLRIDIVYRTCYTLSLVNFERAYPIEMGTNYLW